MSQARIYKMGLCFCSVCAPANMTSEEVVADINRHSPSGTSNGWMLSDDNFVGGEANGFETECEGKPTRHWLLEA